MEPIVVFITAGSRDEAKNISEQLVQRHLVACCNLIDPIQSVFHWKGDVCDEAEVLIVAKSVRTRFKEIIDAVKKMHSYETPEIIAVPIIDGSDDYLQWVSDETT